VLEFSIVMMYNHLCTNFYHNIFVFSASDYRVLDLVLILATLSLGLSLDILSLCLEQMSLESKSVSYITPQPVISPGLQRDCVTSLCAHCTYFTFTHNCFNGHFLALPWIAKTSPEVFQKYSKTAVVEGLLHDALSY